MSGKADAVRMSDYEKFKLYKWLEDNKEALVKERISYKTVAERAGAALQMVVSDRTICKAASALGIEFRKSDGTFVSTLFDKIRALETRVTELESVVQAHETCLVKLQREYAEARKVVLELLTAPAGTTYKILDGGLKRV